MATPFDAEVETLSAALDGTATISRIVRALEHIPAAVLVTDDSGNYIAANHRACELTGFTRAELLDRCIADLTPPEHVPTQERLWNAFGRMGKQQGLYVLRRKDRSAIEVEYRAYANVAPGLHISFLTSIDAQ